MMITLFIAHSTKHMPRGRALSDDARWIILHMSSRLTLDDITHHTGVPRRTIERIVADFRSRGTANRPNSLLQPANRILTMQEVQVSSPHCLVRSVAHIG
jgi:hypothetical protein